MTTILLLVLLCLGLALAGLAVWSRVAIADIESRFEREGRNVEINGGPLNVLELGDSRSGGPPVVLIHDAGKNLKDLKVSLGDRLASERRVILVDRPGHGWSSRIGRDDIATPEGQAVVLNTVLGRIGVDRPLIVGHGWGGALALSYALSFPEEVAGIVVIAPSSHPANRSRTLLERLGASRIGGRIAGLLIAPTFGPVLQRTDLAREFAPQRVPADYPEAVGLALALRPASFRGNAEDAAALGAFLDDQSAYYGQITTPLVIVTGDADQINAPDDNAEKLAAAIPGARLVVLNETGHMPHHTSPNVIAFEINRLAERL